MKQQYIIPKLWIVIMDEKDVILASDVGFQGDDNLTQWNNLWFFNNKEVENEN